MNPVQVAPEQRKVKAGFAREDLFTCVHEQFMTATAKMADVVLPATMFLEHDDVYQGGGHQYIMLGPKLLERARRVLVQPRRHLRPGQARRRRASGLRQEPARDHRLDAAEVRLGHAGRAGREQVDRLPAGVRQGALHQGFRLSRQEVPLQARLGKHSRAAQQRHPHRARDAAPARSLGRDREGGREAPVPALHQPVARLSQLVVQRDADQPGQARQAARQDTSRRSGEARHRRRRPRAHGQRARRDRAGGRGLSRACSAAWSSSRASPPTITSRAAKASTRSPAPIRPRPTAVPPSTTTTCGSEKRKRNDATAGRLRDGGFSAGPGADPGVRRLGAAEPSGHSGRVVRKMIELGLKNIHRALCDGFNQCAPATPAEFENATVVRRSGASGHFGRRPVGVRPLVRV